MNDLQIVEEKKHLDFTKEQLQVIKDSLCKGATDIEFQFFVNVCKARNLSPFAHQLHFVKRWSNEEQREIGSLQTGIGGFRSISEGTRKFAGETQVIWYDKDGAEYKLWTRDENPFAASAGVLKIIGVKENGEPILQEIRETVYWDSVVQKKKDKITPTRMWTGKVGAQQLGKCAKAAAHRAGFGEVLSGIYSDDEMGHLDGEHGAENRQKSQETQEFVATISPETTKLMESLGYNTDAKKRALCTEAENNIEKLDLHLAAVQFAGTLSEKLKEQVKFCGYKNMPEVRRMLVKIGKLHWNDADLNKYLSGEPMGEEAK